MINYFCRPEVQGSPLRNSLFRRQSLGKSSKISDRKKFFERRGSLTMLMEGCNDNKETINSVITKLYRKAEFDLAKAQRGIIFLDGMDKIGNNANISELGRRQVNKFFTCLKCNIVHFEIPKSFPFEISNWTLFFFLNTCRF